MDEPTSPDSRDREINELEDLFGDGPAEKYLTNENYLSALAIAKTYNLPVIPCRGKRPEGIADWPHVGSNDLDEIRRLWRMYPDHENVGIVMGNGYVAIDVDARSGGYESLAELEAKYEKFPETARIRTGGGGLIYIFKAPDTYKGKLPTTTGVFGGGIDLRGDNNGLIIAPHSIHPVTGNKYEWDNWGTPIAVMPGWLLKAILNAEKEQKRVLKLFMQKKVRIPKKMHKSELTPLLVGLAMSVKRRYGYDGEDLVAEMYRFCQQVAEDPAYYSMEYVRKHCGYALEKKITHRDTDEVNLRQNEDGSFVEVKDGKEIERTVVKVNNKQTHTIANELLKVLAVQNNPPTLFMQKGRLVEMDEQGETLPVNYEALTAIMDASCTIVTETKAGQVPTKLDKDIARSILSRPHSVKTFPELRAVVRTPMFLKDGRILDAPGYDEESGYYLALEDGFQLYERPEPSQEAAKRAYQYLVDEVFRDFPFEDEASLVNAMGFVVGSAAKGFIDACVPLCLLIARAPDTGKTLISRAIIALATGRSEGVHSLPNSNEETKKQLVSHFLGHPAGTIFDNVVGDAAVKLNMGVLNAALTSGIFRSRILGVSKDLVYDMRGHIIIINGNNLNVGGELARRSVPVTLNSDIADPAMRVPEGGFKHEGEKLITWCVENRGLVNSLLLTILESWWAEYQRTGVMPGAGQTPILDSFESWTRVVGSILSFCGVGELFMFNRADVMSTLSTGADEDYAFMVAIRSAFGEKPFKAKELAGKLNNGGPLYDFIPEQLAHFLALYKTEVRAVAAYLSMKREVRFGEESLLLTNFSDEELAVKKSKKALAKPKKDRSKVLTWRVLAGR